jgi:hypothetical protein
MWPSRVKLLPKPLPQKSVLLLNVCPFGIIEKMRATRSKRHEPWGGSGCYVPKSFKPELECLGLGSSPHNIDWKEPPTLFKVTIVAPFYEVATVTIRAFTHG